MGDTRPNDLSGTGQLDSVTPVEPQLLSPSPCSFQIPIQHNVPQMSHRTSMGGPYFQVPPQYFASSSLSTTAMPNYSNWVPTVGSPIGSCVSFDTNQNGVASSGSFTSSTANPSTVLLLQQAQAAAQYQQQQQQQQNFAMAAAAAAMASGGRASSVTSASYPYGLIMAPACFSPGGAIHGINPFIPQQNLPSGALGANMFLSQESAPYFGVQPPMGSTISSASLNFMDPSPVVNRASHDIPTNSSQQTLLSQDLSAASDSATPLCRQQTNPSMSARMAKQASTAEKSQSSGISPRVAKRQLLSSLLSSSSSLASCSLSTSSSSLTSSLPASLSSSPSSPSPSSLSSMPPASSQSMSEGPFPLLSSTSEFHETGISESSAIPAVQPHSSYSGRGLQPGEHESWISPLTIDDLVNEIQTVINYDPDSHQPLSPSLMFNLHSRHNKHRVVAAIQEINHVVCQVCFETQRPSQLCFFGDFLVECVECHVVVHRRCYGVHRMVQSNTNLATTTSNQTRCKFLCDLCRNFRIERAKHRLALRAKTSSPDTPASTTAYSNAQTNSLTSTFCMICNRNEGPRKRTSSGEWVHVYCALFFPSLIRIGDLRNMDKFERLDGGVKKKPTETELIVSDVLLTQEISSPSTAHSVTNPFAVEENSAVKLEGNYTGNDDSTDGSHHMIKNSEPFKSKAIEETYFESATSEDNSDLIMIKKENQLQHHYCHVCKSSNGYFLKCQADGCQSLFHPYCLKSFMHQCEQEGRNQVSTCLEFRIKEQPKPEQTSNTGLAVDSSVDILSLDFKHCVEDCISVYCLDHAPSPQYCICRRPFDLTIDAQLMVGCDVCGDWLHSYCIGADAGVDAAQSAIEVENYQCKRCLQQRSHLAMLDWEWAQNSSSVLNIEDYCLQSRRLLRLMFQASSVILKHESNQRNPMELKLQCFPPTFDIGVVLPKHLKPLPFTDLLLIATAWFTRVDFILSADRIPFPLQSRSHSPPPSLANSNMTNSQLQALSTAPAADLTIASALGKKKIQLKKKIKSATNSAVNSVGGTPPKASSNSTQLPLSVEKKKSAVGTSNTKFDSLKKIEMGGGVSNTTIKSKLPHKVSSKTTGGNVSLKVLKHPLFGKETVNQSSKLSAKSGSKKKLVQSSLGSNLARVGSQQDTKSEVAGAAAVPTVSTTAIATRKATGISVARSNGKSNGWGSLFETVSEPICRVSSLRRIAAAAISIPIEGSRWLKDLAACIDRCEAWLNLMKTALKEHNAEQIQLCLSSHSLPIIQQYASIKSEARTAPFKLPSVNRVSRLCIYIPNKPFNEVIASGGLSNSTFESITLRKSANEEIFLQSNRGILVNCASTLSIHTLKKVVEDVESNPDLESLKNHEIYTKSQKYLQKVQECLLQAKTLKASSKPSLSDIEALVSEVRSGIPSDAGVDLFTFPELLFRGRSLEAQIDWNSLSSLRDVHSQVQHLPMTSSTFQKLQKVLVKVDGWRRDFQRVVSLMRSTESESSPEKDKSAAHRKNIVVSGQSGFLKDLFGIGGARSLNEIGGAYEDSDNSFVYTQSQGIDEVRSLLVKGLELSIPCEEIVQLQGWIDECDSWTDSVRNALEPSESHYSECSSFSRQSWNIEGLKELQKQKTSLPFAIDSNLYSRLEKRIEKLAEIESHLLTTLLDNSPFIPSTEISAANAKSESFPVDIQSFLSTTDALLQGAELSGTSTLRTFRLRELKNDLLKHIQNFNEWRDLVESVINSTDKVLIAFTPTSESSSIDCVLPKSLHSSCVSYPLAPYGVGGNIKNCYPLINAQKLVESHWFEFSEEELRGLKHSVAASIQIIENDDETATANYFASEGGLNPAAEDSYDDELFEIDNSLQSITSGVEVIKRVSQKYNKIRDSTLNDSNLSSSSSSNIELLQLLIKHSVVSLVHFLALCAPSIIRENLLFPLFQVSIIPLLLILGIDGRSLFATLLPAPSEILRRCIRNGGSLSTTASSEHPFSAVKVPSLSSDVWKRSDFQWRFFHIKPDPVLISCCISRLIGLWILVSPSLEGILTRSPESDIDSLIQLVTRLCDVSGDIDSDIVAESLDLSNTNQKDDEIVTNHFFCSSSFLSKSEAHSQLRVLSILQRLKQICSKNLPMYKICSSVSPQQNLSETCTSIQNRLPLDSLSLEFQLLQLLKGLTWELRAKYVVDVLYSKNESFFSHQSKGKIRITLNEICILLIEYEKKFIESDINSSDILKRSLINFNQESKENVLNLWRRLKSVVDDSNRWLQNLNQKLLETPNESLILVPPLLSHWDSAASMIPTFQPDFILASVIVVSGGENCRSCLPSISVSPSLPASVVPTFIRCNDWNLSDWNRVSAAFRTDWKLQLNSLLIPFPGDDLFITQPKELPALLSSIQEIVLLVSYGEQYTQQQSQYMLQQHQQELPSYIPQYADYQEINGRDLYSHHNQHYNNHHQQQPQQQQHSMKILKSLSDEGRHYQIFQEAIDLSLSMSIPFNCQDFSNRSSALPDQIRSIIDRLWFFSLSNNTVRCPMFFPRLCTSRLIKHFNMMDQQKMELTGFSTVCMAWLKSLSVCLLQGWASFSSHYNHHREVSHQNFSYNDIAILKCNGKNENERMERCHLGVIAVATRLIELIKARRSELMQFFTDQPPLCQTSTNASKFLNIELKLCEWVVAAVMSLSQLNLDNLNDLIDDSSFTFCSIVKGKSHIHQLLLLSRFLQHLKTLLKEAIESDTISSNILQSSPDGMCYEPDWSSVVNSLCIGGSIDNLGGFLAVEISNRLDGLQKILRSESSSQSVKSNISMLEIMKQHFLLKQTFAAYLTSPQHFSLGSVTPASSANLLSSNLFISSNHLVDDLAKMPWALEAEDSLHSLSSELQSRLLETEFSMTLVKSFEAAALSLFKILFALFLRECMNYPKSNQIRRDQSALLNELMEMLPPTLFSQLSVSNVGELPEESKIPKIEDMGMLYMSESVGIVVCQINTSTSKSTMIHPTGNSEIEFGNHVSSSNIITRLSGECPYDNHNRCDDSLSTQFMNCGGNKEDQMEESLDTVAFPIFFTKSLLLLFHPRFLLLLSIAVTLNSAFCFSWKTIMDEIQNEEILQSFMYIDSTVSSEQINQFSLTGLIEFFFSALTKRNASLLISNVLLLPLKTLFWRLKTLPYLFPKFAPFDILEDFLREYQELIPLQEKIIHDTSVPLPDDLLFSQLLDHHQIVRQGENQTVVQLLQSLGGSPLIQEQSTNFLTRKALRLPVEQEEFSIRYSRTNAVMFECTLYPCEVGLSNKGFSVNTSATFTESGQRVNQSVPSGLPGTKSLALTSRILLREQLVLHPATESLNLYLEDLSVWEQTTKHILAQLQARQEIQHRMLGCIQSIRQQQHHLRGPSSTDLSFNSWEMKVMNRQFVQLLWDAYGMSSALDVKPTLDSNQLLGFPSNAIYYNSLKLMVARGEALNCSGHNPQLHSLYYQLTEAVKALDHLVVQSTSQILKAKQLMNHKEPSATAAGTPKAIETSCITRDQVELFLQQSLFAELPTHPYIKDLFQRIIKVEYLATLAFGLLEQTYNDVPSNTQTALSRLSSPSLFLTIPDMKICLPVAENTSNFYQYEEEIKSLVDVSENGNIEASSIKPLDEGDSCLSSLLQTMHWTDLLVCLYDRCQTHYCPVPSPCKSQILENCWMSATRLLFVIGDPFGCPNLPNRKFRTPALKSIQHLHSMGRQMFGNTPPPEMKLLKVFLGAAKALLTEARSSVDQWVRIRCILCSLPLYLKEELRMLRIRLQQKFNIFIEVVSKNQRIQEVNIYKESKLRQRYSVPADLIDVDDELNSPSSTTAAAEFQSSLTLVDDNEKDSAVTAGTVASFEQQHYGNKTNNQPPSEIIPAIFRHATNYKEQHNHRNGNYYDESNRNCLTNTIETFDDESQGLFERVREGVRFCITSIFNDGEEGATQREAILYETVNYTIDDEYFKGFHQLINKKLQQSVEARKIMPSLFKQRGTATDTTLNSLLLSNASAGKFGRTVEGAAQKETLKWNVPDSKNKEENKSGSFLDSIDKIGTPTTVEQQEIDELHQTSEGFCEREADFNQEDIHDELTPIEAAGFLWTGQISGYTTNIDHTDNTNMLTTLSTSVSEYGSCNEIQQSSVFMPLWIVPLFDPVPVELRRSLRSFGSFSFEKKLSINQFSEHLQMISSDKSVTQLNVLLGADWCSTRHEIASLVNLIRPRKLHVPSAVAKSHLSQFEIEALQNEALSKSVHCLSFCGVSNDDCNEADPNRPSASLVRLWIIPPTPKLTEALLPSLFPKSSQLVFGLMEVFYDRNFNVKPVNYLLGHIRSVSQSISHSITEMQREQLVRFSHPSTVEDSQNIRLPPPQSIPPFTTFRISVPTTDFEFVPVKLSHHEQQLRPNPTESFSASPDKHMEEQVLQKDKDYLSFNNDNQPVNTAESQRFSKVYSDDAGVAVSRIPKRPRLTGEVENQIINSSALLPPAIFRSDVRPHLQPVKIPPWQQQKNKEVQQFPWKNQINNNYVKSEHQVIESKEITNNDGRLKYALQTVIDPYSQLQQQQQQLNISIQPQYQQTTKLSTVPILRNIPPWQRVKEFVNSNETDGNNSNNIFNTTVDELLKNKNDENINTTNSNNG